MKHADKTISAEGGHRTAGPSVLQNKYFLYTTGFFSGMSVMAIELGASRLLAPYFSSSQIVWTIIIGTIMIAMALGNVWGGRRADKNPDPKKLYFSLLLVAVWTAAIPFLGKYVIAGVSAVLAFSAVEQFLLWAPFLSCLLLFFFPLFLLGTVTPSLTKYATGSLESNGKTVGELQALGTIGSIIGTFLPTFVTIPAAGTAATFLIFALVLAAISLVYFCSAGIRRIRGAVVCGGIVLLLCLPIQKSFAFWETDLVYEGESIYNYLQVRETDSSVILSTNVAVGVQSVMMKDGGLTGMYYDYALAAPLMAGALSEAQEILILGLGTGTYAKLCLDYFPNASITGVEIDEKIIDLGKLYFDLPEEVEVSIFDGRAYLERAGMYHVIMVDAYQDITIPFQMASREFFTQVQAHLREGGVMAVNLNMAGEGDGSIGVHLRDTIASVFSHVYSISLPDSSNIVLLATDNPQAMKAFAAGYHTLPDGPLRALMEWTYNFFATETGGDLILTDDKAPVEQLGLHASDAYIRDMIGMLGEAFSQGDFSILFGG